VRCRPLGLALALGSHFVLDAIPHFEDPSLLPGWLAPAVSSHWGALLAGSQVGVVVLALAVCWRFRRRERDRAAFAAYLVVGGLLACSPDYLVRLMGPHGFPALVNSLAHQWWVRPYLKAVRTHADWRPAVVFACLSLEAGLSALAAWLLFRRPGASALAQAPAT
jgi:hypothetical protein